MAIETRTEITAAEVNVGDVVAVGRLLDTVAAIHTDGNLVRFGFDLGGGRMRFSHTMVNDAIVARWTN